MLPWLKNKKDSGSASASSPVIKRDHDEDYEYDSMEAAAEDLCNALEKKDYKAVAEALRAAFEIFDTSPHEEYDHDEDQY